MEIRAAKETEFDEIIDLLCTVFIAKCRPRYTSQIYSDSSYQLHQSRVCIVDGKIVSHVRVSDRAIHIGRSVVRLGGIGMVATLPEYRRRGYATAVMQDAIAYMEEQGYDLSLLFTSIQPAPRHEFKNGKETSINGIFSHWYYYHRYCDNSRVVDDETQPRTKNG